MLSCRHRVQQGHKITWNLTTTDIGAGTDTNIIDSSCYTIDTFLGTSAGYFSGMSTVLGQRNDNLDLSLSVPQHSYGYNMGDQDNQNHLQRNARFVIRNSQHTNSPSNLGHEVYPHFPGVIVKHHYGKTTLSTPDLDSSPNILVISTLVYCKSDDLDHTATESGMPLLNQIEQTPDKKWMLVDIAAYWAHP
uniref:Uncharacterized protein n=1 Tax=Timema cristinae TaxID=61476 RepID=A0A7R9CD05_TIMCR|nr:unnamed protein product [Timema cristinae]